MQQRASLQQIGDVSLFISGFFSDSLQRKLVDVDYYVSIGGFAYNALSRVETDTFSPVFAELAEKFVGFVDVLTEVSERTSCASNADLLRLYEKWLKTGSRRSGQLLSSAGSCRTPRSSRPASNRLISKIDGAPDSVTTVSRLRNRVTPPTILLHLAVSSSDRQFR